ncbi:MAG TPA: hypothetical protein VHM26_07585 [Chitinophagaceae bacterium]|jgi:hypothetical protein|nr:hypothetical protein [Chitinophagaceae bacterium]
MSQKIIITTSPWKDYKNNKWMLSAFMSIQLDAGVNSKLSAFPDILQWIDRLAQAKFFVQWNNDKPKDITPISAKWDKTLYEKLFHGNILVKTFKPLTLEMLTIKSYPAMHINDFILNTYMEVGNLKSDELPTSKFYTQEFTRMQAISQVQLQSTRPLTGRNVSTNDFLKKGHNGKEAVKQQVKQNKAVAFSKNANANMDFGQFHNFHTQIDKTVFKHPSKIEKPEFEYHDILGIISSYPTILRKLGLVIDFELGTAPPIANGTVRILPANLSFTGDVDTSCPATAFQYTGKGFFAASKAGSFIEKGMLKLNTDDFSVVQIDVDGAALKLAGHADAVNYRVAKSLVTRSNYIKPVMEFERVNRSNRRVNLTPVINNNNANNNDEDDDDADEGLPSLRSAGIGIVKNGLAENLVKKFNRNLELYKVMISPVSLLNGPALFNKVSGSPGTNPNPVILQGGQVKLSAARLTEIGNAVQQSGFIPAVTEVLYADDLVFGYRLDVAYDDKPNTWYSLHKRRNSYSFVPVSGTPQSIAQSADELVDEGCIHLSLTEDENDDSKDNKINEVMARWEGWSLSVPRLGKGINNGGGDVKDLVSSDDDEKKKYQLDKDMSFRLQVTTEHAPRTLPMLRFGNRYRIKVRTVDIAGNGLPHDVVPENETVAIKTGIKYLRFEPLPSPVLVQGDEVTGGDKKKMRDRDGESIQHLVIRSNVGVDAATYEKNNITTVVIDGKGVGTLTYLHEAIRFVQPPRTSQQMAEIHGMFDEAFKNPDKAKQLYKFISDHDKFTVDDGKRKADVLPYTTDPTKIDIDYLADPMAAGVIFTMKSDTTFETSWKKGVSRKFSFYFDPEVTDANANQPYADKWQTPRALKIRLIEGTGEPKWEGRVFTIQLPKSAQVEINYACFWRPEDLDKVSGMMPRISGGSFASRVTQHARKGLHWMFSPWRTLRLVHAVQQPLTKPVMQKTMTVSHKNYEDTFARIATGITLDGPSSDKIDVNAEWKQWVDDLDDAAPKQVSGKTHVATIPVEYDDKKLDLLNAGGPMIVTPEMLPALKHSFNDTKHRMVRYIPVATTRYREYFTGIIDTSKLAGKQLPLTQVGDPVEVNILSSAKPVVPTLAYTVPSFNWMRDDKGSTVSHLRTANIRVYMKRPWYSSGDDERLAVILPPKDMPNPARNKALEKYCTVWGKDPVYVSGDLNALNFPQLDHFPFGIQRTDPKIASEEEAVKAACIYDTVKIGDDNITVQVAAYKVLFDAEKQMYYADIPIFVGFAYFPFVRLSLARYQRNSVRKDGKDCCLSNMVQAEWMQVLPARATAVSFSGGKNSFNVALKGVAPFTFNADKFPAANNNARVRINITVEDARFAKTEEAFISINDRTTRTFIWAKDYQLTLQEIKNGQIDFLQKVDIPAEWSSKPFRIIIREYEQHEFDPLRAQEKAFTDKEKYHEYGDRLVFMDVFEVNGSV